MLVETAVHKPHPDSCFHGLIFSRGRDTVNKLCKIYCILHSAFKEKKRKWDIKCLCMEGMDIHYRVARENLTEMVT